MSSLSICLISKDEEKNIRRCLESVANIADEIVLVDTGSTDKTIDIAREFNAKIINTTWNNDFSTPRNLSLDNATSDWILFLDCDEELSVDESVKLKSLINSNTSKEAYHLKIKTLLSSQDAGSAIVLRLFKNKKEYRFVGKMHEQIINSILDFGGPDCIGMEEIIINHYGYDPEISDQEKKMKRNLEILLSYDDIDKDGYYYYALGNEYSRLNDLEKALEIYDISLNMTNYRKNKNIYFTYLILNIMKINYALKRHAKVIDYFDTFIKEVKNFKDLYFMASLSFIELGQYSKANKSLLNYINCNEQNFEYPSFNFEQTYNIDDMLAQTNSHAVGACLSSAIFINKPPQNIKETIKSVNEISNDVVIVVDNDNMHLLDSCIEDIKNSGASILSLKKENLQKELYFINKRTKGDYLLILNDDEIVPHQYLCRFIDLYNYSKSKGFYLNVQNIQNGLVAQSLKIIKKDKNIKSLHDLREFTLKNVSSIPSLNIEIFKGNNF